ncbi:MAG: alpha/beta fold hydrolase [Janthinobacterium lividum]
MSLVLVPGFMLDADLWRDVSAKLQVFGPLSHADLSRDDTMTAMARRTLAAAPASFALIGFSMGGYVAREMTRIAPDRVSALVLIATSARDATPVQTQRKAAAATRAAAAGFRGLSRSAVALSLHPDHASDEALTGRIHTMGARLGREVFLRQCMLDRQGDLDWLHEIRCPTLIVAGKQDKLRSLAEAAELHQGIAGSDLTVIDGTGHMIPMEAPARLVEAIVPWLADRLASP